MLHDTVLVTYCDEEGWDGKFDSGDLSISIMSCGSRSLTRDAK
jgi:hypothetical protein